MRASKKTIEEFDLSQRYAEIPLRRGYVALVDEEDAAWLQAYRWTATKSGLCIYATASAKNGGERIWMHRLILSAPKGVPVDHKNGNGLDNRRCNIRLATWSQNSSNRTRLNSNNPHGFKGVTKYTAYPNLRKPWQASIGVRGKRIRLGYFATPEEAAAAYDVAVLKHHGEFGVTNAEIHRHNSVTTPSIRTLGVLHRPGSWRHLYEPGG